AQGACRDSTSKTTDIGVVTCSAAANWWVWTNPATPGGVTTTTALTSMDDASLPAGCRGGTGNVVHVTTQATNNGLFQGISSPGAAPSHATVAARVCVHSGQVGIGAGNGGSTGLDARSVLHDQWESLSAPNNSNGPVNQMVIYSV